MRQYASLVIAALLAAGTLGCGNTETNQVTKDKKKVRVNWTEQDQKSDEWWANENTKKRQASEPRESDSEYVAEREEDRADADQDRPLSERRRRRRTAKFAADERTVEGDRRDERPADVPEIPRRRLTDDIAEDEE